MNLPTLINQLYGVFTFTGLYSFEFVDKNRNTIVEIFFMMPPKTKTVNEPTRSSTVPTLNGSYNNDAGNATKKITLTGDLFFPYVGSPYNPVAKDSTNLQGTIDGMTEFLKLRWMLIRYRDYTLSKRSKLSIPITSMAKSNEIVVLYKKIARQLARQVGALYDEIQLIFHDYDMDDHFYCRIENFSSNQSDSKYIAIGYTIELDCYETDTMHLQNIPKQVKQSANDEVNSINNQIQNLNFTVKFDDIQTQISYNAEFISGNNSLQILLENINTENEKIQAGQATVFTMLPVYIYTLSTTIQEVLSDFLVLFLSNDDQTSYNSGTLTLDDVLDYNLLSYHNTLQKIKIYANSLKGVINSIARNEEVRYYSNADDYTLTSEQFDSDDENIVSNEVNFYYYTVMEGDTARIIALRELKNSDKYISILKLNKISENDFIDNMLLGEKIKIPIQETVISRGNENLVYESNQDDIEKYLFGIDIATDINKRLKLSAKGDLASIGGIENVCESIERRIKNTKGSLNVFNPNWGVISIDDGDAPLMVKIDRYITDVVNQIQSDPRIENVNIDLSKLEWNGEVIKLYSKIYFIGVEEHKEIVA